MDRTNRHYVVTLALVAATILAVGSLLRPAPVADDRAPPSPPQADLGRLARLAQRRSLDNMTDYFAAVANDVEASVVGLRLLARSGVVWEPGLVVTTRLEPRFPDATVVSTPGGELGAASAGSGPHLPLALVRVPSAGEFTPIRRRASTRLDPGVWTVFVSERGRPGFTPATYRETSALRCDGHMVGDVVTSVALTPELAGAGLFDLDGNLLGVVLRCGDRFAVVPVGDIDSLVRLARSVHGRIAQRYGLGLEAVTPEERSHLGVTFGLMVREIWTGYLAEAAGLVPGDVIVAINAEPIGAIDQLGPLVDAGDVAAYDLTVTRGDDIVGIQLPTDPAVFAAREAEIAVEGLVWDDPNRGYRIDTVLPSTPAARAGLRAGDRLLRIDGEMPDDLDAVRAALSPSREVSVMLELERGARRWAVVLPSRTPDPLN